MFVQSINLPKNRLRLEEIKVMSHQSLEAFLERFDMLLSPIGCNNMQRENTEDYFTKCRIRKGVETAFIS